MKKALLLIVILSISVISTACINNLAVQELNAKAKTYMDNGDTENAIARLKSSVDLDPTIFESYYNLAVAYTRAEDYLNAVGKADEKEKFDKYIEYLKGSVSSIDACIGFLASDMGKQIYGDKRDEALKFAEDKKAAGEKVCTCPACQAGDVILKNI